MTGDASQHHIEISWRSSARYRPRHFRHIGQLTTRSIWNPATNYHTGGSTTSQNLNRRRSRPRLKQTWQAASFSGQHPQPQRWSWFQRRQTEHYSCVSTIKLLTLAQWRIDTPFLWSQNYSIECMKPGSSLRWTSGMPTTSSDSKKETNWTLYSEPAIVSSNTKLCPSDWQTHRLNFMLTSTIVYGPTLTTSLCVTLTMNSSTRPMRRSANTTSEKFCTAYRNSGYIARPNSAILEFGKSAFSDLSSIRMRSEWSQTAYPRLKTGRPQNQFGRCKCFSPSQTSTGHSFWNKQGWWLPYQTCSRHMAHGSGNGLGMPNSHFENSKRPLPKHQSSSISTLKNRSFCRPMQAASQSPASLTSTTDLDSSPSRFLLSKMLSRWTALRHVQLGAPGDCNDNEKMETLSRERKSQAPDPVRL